MDTVIETERSVDPFFEDAVNTIFLKSDKTAFVMDGPVGLGKSTNFVARGMITTASCVDPIKKRGKLVRESKWAAIRESENSARASVMQMLEESVFSPEIMAIDNPPVTVSGNHPAIIRVNHSLADGTELDLKIECHGFNNPKAFDRLKTHEFTGAIIFELQAIPFNVFETAVERCGRFRAKDMIIRKNIDGKEYTLSGQNQLCVVLADVNIPQRPHPLYERFYDKPANVHSPYELITLPPPIKPIPVDKATDEILNKYPTSIFERNEVVWIPNPEVYLMTSHYESKDENGKNIPWTGYGYWFSMVDRTDSDVRRYVLGKPDNKGGAAAIYKSFDKKDKSLVLRKKIKPNLPAFIGFDPGGNAAAIICQSSKTGNIHWFKEFIVAPEDGITTRSLFSDFVFPYCRKNLSGSEIFIIPDPASTELFKNRAAGHQESALQMVREECISEMEKHNACKYTLQFCLTSNQDTESRLNSLGYFLEKRMITVDPSLTTFIDGISGGYCRVTLSNGTISEAVDKKNKYSHVVEAAQYVAVNLLIAYKARKSNARRTIKRSGFTKVRNRRTSGRGLSSI